MENMDKLLAGIDSKLNILLVMTYEYQAKIPTLIIRINEAKVHLQNSQIEALLFDLEWITDTILKKKALRRLFEFQTLDLNLLKEKLKRSFTTLKPADALAKAVYQQRHALARAFEKLENYFRILSEKTIKLSLDKLNSSLRSAVNAERNLKSKLFVPNQVKELEINQAISILTTKIIDLNKILISISKIDGMEGMQKVLVYDWNDLINIIINILKNVYQEIKSTTIMQSIQDKGMTIIEFSDTT